MPSPQLVEYAKRRLAKGDSPSEIESHLRSQGWEEEVVARVLAEATGATPLPPPSPERGPRRAKRLLLAALAILAAILVAACVGGYFAYRQYAAAKLIREKIRFVEISGNVTGQLEIANPGKPTAVQTLELLGFRGVADSSQEGDPRAAIHFALGSDGRLLAALEPMSLATDARFLGASLLALGGAGKIVGGTELRLAGDSAYIRCDRSPLGALETNPVTALIGAFVGPTPLTGAWLQIPLRENVSSPASTSSEWLILAGLVLRPTEKIFWENQRLHFTGKSEGEAVAGTATEIQRFSIDGPWMTSELVRALRESKLDDNMRAVAAIQKILTGGRFDEATSSLDTLQVSDGEVEVWVGKEDRLPYRISIEMSVREGQRSPATLKLEALTNLAYGRPAKVDMPKPTVSLEELQQKLGALEAFGQMFKGP